MDDNGRRVLRVRHYGAGPKNSAKTYENNRSKNENERGWKTKASPKNAKIARPWYSLEKKGPKSKPKLWTPIIVKRREKEKCDKKENCDV